MQCPCPLENSSLVCAKSCGCDLSHSALWEFETRQREGLRPWRVGSRFPSSEQALPEANVVFAALVPQPKETVWRELLKFGAQAPLFDFERTEPDAGIIILRLRDGSPNELIDCGVFYRPDQADKDAKDGDKDSKDK